MDLAGYRIPQEHECMKMRRRSKEEDFHFTKHLKYQLDSFKDGNDGLPAQQASAMDKAVAVWTAAAAALVKDNKTFLNTPFSSSLYESLACDAPGSSAPGRRSPSSSASLSSQGFAPATPTPSAEYMIRSSQENLDGLCSLSGSSCARRNSAALRAISSSSIGTRGISSGSSSPCSSSPNTATSAPAQGAVGSFLSGAVIGSKPAPPPPLVAPSARRGGAPAQPARLDSATAAAAATTLLRKAISTPLERVGFVAKSCKEKAD